MKGNKKINPDLATDVVQARISGDFDSFFDRNFDRFMMEARKVQYKKATLLKPKKAGATWFIIWYEFNPHSEKLERIRKTLNINRIANLKEREAHGWKLCTLINTALANGWRYLTENKIPGTEVQAKSDFKNIVDAMNFALLKKSLSLKKRSVESYRSGCKLFCDFLTENNLHQIGTKDLSEKIIQEYVFYRLEKSSSAKSVNSQLGYLHTIFEIIKKYDRLENNPFKIDKLPETESELYEALTESELKQITALIKPLYPDYFLFLQFIYWESIRPYHVAQLQAKSIDYTNDTITNLGGNNKNRKRQMQQLMSAVKSALIETGRDKLPSHYYLFGKDFKPSETPLESISTRAGEMWKELVQKKLGINKKMYALKHTFNQLYLSNNDNIDLGWLQHHNKHASLEETNIYAAKRRVKKIDESAINIPAF